MSTNIKVDGTWLISVGTWSELKWSTIADGGCEAASWTMNKPREFSHPALVAGSLVELKLGPRTFWSGTLSEPTFVPDQGWNYNVKGLCKQGDGCICFDGSLNTTSKPDTAIDQGIARGLLDWIRPASLSSTAFAATDTTDALNTVTDLLKTWGTSVSKRIRVDGDQVVGAYTDPTVPDWYLAPGLAQVGVADEDYATDLYLRYRSSLSTYATVHVSDPDAAAVNPRELALDATNLGVTTNAKVTAIGNGLIAKGKARYAMTQSVSPSRLQLTGEGGKPAPLALVRGGQLVRAFDVRTTQGPALPYFDFVIGRTDYTDLEQTITLASVELADRNLVDVLTAALKAAA